MSQPRKSRVGWVVLGLAVVAGGIAFASQALGGRKPTPLSMETVVVDKGRIAARISASGTLTALVTVQVGSQVSGRIDSLRVDFNSRVKKGDVIATLDAALFTAAVEQAKANLAVARANREQAVAQAEDSARQLARAGRFLMGGDGPRMVSPARVRRINALMMTCGHYDGSGEFAYRVGLPGKSGVGGGILVIAPGRASIAVWSPGLNAQGNSQLGTLAVERLARATGWSVFG